MKNDLMYPRQSPTTHTEQLGDEASVYDWARAQVHALNPTAARVWRRCDGATSPDAIAAALRVETGVAEADAVVELTLGHLARLHLLERGVESRGVSPATTRRWLLGRGVAAAMLPAIYSIAAPSPVEAQSAGPAVPTLTSVSPSQGIQGTTVAVTLTGTNFIVGGTTVNVSGSGVTIATITVNRIRSLTARANGTSLIANFVIDPAAGVGPRTVTVTTVAGTSGGQTFTITLPTPGAPTLTSVSPNQGTRGTTVAVALTGTNFVAGATTVTVGGSGATVTNVAVSSGTSLTANFVLDAAATEGPRTVTVTTAIGTSGARIFTISLAPPGAPTLTGVVPNQGIVGATVPVALTGTNFVVGATTVNVSGSGVTVNTVVVDSSTSLTANFVLDPAAATGPRTVTVTTAAGTSGAQTFTINLPPGTGIPSLTSVTPNQGIRGTSVAVTLTGTNFVVGATTVNVGGSGVTVTNVVVGSATSLTASFVLDPAAAEGPRTVTLTTAAGTSGPQAFTVSLPPPTLTSVSPNQGIRGTTVAVTLTGSHFVVGDTTVTVGGSGVTATNVIVGSSTSVTASFVLDLAAAAGPRTVTVTTADGTSGPQTFTVNLPLPGTTTFNYTGGSEAFVVPAGVVSITIVATGAQGGIGFGALGAVGGLGGRTTATVSVTPGASLTVRVGGVGPNGAADSATAGGFNGGGGSDGDGGGGGGASSVRDGATPLVVVGGGGGGGAESGGTTRIGGSGGAGGGLAANPGQSPPQGGGGGGGGTQSVGGTGGTRGSVTGANGTAGASVQGGVGGAHQPGVIGGGGGGGGYFGGGGGGGGNPSDAGGGGGGGGSSFTAPGATAVVHEQGVKASNGFVTISW